MIADSSASASLLAILTDRGRRSTGPRRRVAELVATRRGHFTAGDIEVAARAGGQSVGRATIFRALELLAGAGVIERIDLPSGEHAWVACEPEHHHHVICARCGRAAEFDDAGLAAVVTEVAARTGFTIDAHRVELFGRCADCSGRAMS